MITSQTPTEIEVTVDQTRSVYVTLECNDSVLLSFLGIDSGDGYRPFHPLLFTLDGVAATLPLEVAPGSHVLELLGEWFEGTGLLVVGYGLHTVTALTLGSQVATVPGYYEASGPPEDNAALLARAINGARYKDTFGKIRYELSEGVWIQLAS